MRLKHYAGADKSILLYGELHRLLFTICDGGQFIWAIKAYWSYEIGEGASTRTDGRRLLLPLSQSSTKKPQPPRTDDDDRALPLLFGGVGQSEMNWLANDGVNCFVVWNRVDTEIHPKTCKTSVQIRWTAPTVLDLSSRCRGRLLFGLTFCFSQLATTLVWTVGGLFRLLLCYVWWM